MEQDIAAVVGERRLDDRSDSVSSPLFDVVTLPYPNDHRPLIGDAAHGARASTSGQQRQGHDETADSDEHEYEPRPKDLMERHGTWGASDEEAIHVEAGKNGERSPAHAEAGWTPEATSDSPGQLRAQVANLLVGLELRFDGFAQMRGNWRSVL